MIVNHAKWVQKPEPTQSSQQRRSGSDSRRSMGPTLTGGNTLEGIGKFNVVAVPEAIKADARLALDRMLKLPS